jgi:hypothetical protein
LLTHKSRLQLRTRNGAPGLDEPPPLAQNTRLLIQCAVTPPATPGGPWRAAAPVCCSVELRVCADTRPNGLAPERLQNFSGGRVPLAGATQRFLRSWELERIPSSTMRVFLAAFLLIGLIS